MHQRIVVVGGIALALFVMAGCGGKSADPEVAAVTELLAQERSVIAGARQAKRESASAEQQGYACASAVCFEAAATLVEASTREIEKSTRRLNQIEAKVNGYSREAIEAAYRQER